MDYSSYFWRKENDQQYSTKRYGEIIPDMRPDADPLGRVAHDRPASERGGGDAAAGRGRDGPGGRARRGAGGAGPGDAATPDETGRRQPVGRRLGRRRDLAGLRPGAEGDDAPPRPGAARGGKKHLCPSAAGRLPDRSRQAGEIRTAARPDGPAG